MTSSDSFRWLGRIDNVINSGGIKIHLEKIDRAVDSVLSDLDVNADYFSWYMADERWGQKLILFIACRPNDIHEKEVLDKLTVLLSPYEMPKSIYFAESFVKTPSGKTDKIRTARSILPAIG